MNQNADIYQHWQVPFLQGELVKKLFHLQKGQEDQKEELALRTMKILNMSKPCSKPLESLYRFIVGVYTDLY